MPLMRSFKRQLSAALAYSTDADNIQTLIRSWKDKFVVKPQDLSAWYYQFLAHQTTQETVWVWARENWDWIKAALGGDMSFDSLSSSHHTSLKQKNAWLSIRNSLNRNFLT